MDGVAGIYDSTRSRNLVHNTFLATGVLQHRGLAGAGIAIGNGKGIHIYNGIGRIGDVIQPGIMQTFQDLEPVGAIGNVGYTKNAIPENRNVEPIEISPKTSSNYQVVLTLDGYLVQENDLKAKLEPDYQFHTGNKTEVIGALLHKAIKKHGITTDAGKEITEELSGRATYALTALVYDGKDTYMIALNDERAFEPFCYGTIDNAFVISTESVSHRRLGGFAEAEYDGAYMTICSPDNDPIRQFVGSRNLPLMPDIFQGIYFGHVGSMFRDKEIFQIRRELGWGSVQHYGIPPADIHLPNPESGWGFTLGVFEATVRGLKETALDMSRYDNENLIVVKDKAAFEKWMSLETVYPALVKQAQAVRTFQEAQRRAQLTLTGLKFGAIESLIRGKRLEVPDDSTVKATVGEGGSHWALANAGATEINHRASYPPMFFPSFKEWHLGRQCLEVLATQKSFPGDDSPYDKSLEEVNKAVAKLYAQKLRDKGQTDCDVTVMYTPVDVVKSVCGPGSYQALDASYPIDERFWPDWLKEEVEEFNRLTA